LLFDVIIFMENKTREKLNVYAVCFALPACLACWLR